MTDSDSASPTKNQKRESSNLRIESQPQIDDVETSMPSVINKNTNNFHPISDRYPSSTGFQSFSNLSQAGFQSFRSSKKDRLNQSMREFQNRRGELQRLVKHHLHFTAFPQTRDQTVDYFAKYQAKQPEFDKDLIESDMHFQIRHGKESVYFGSVINDKKHGKGLILYKNGRLYEGEWENDLKHGKGFEIFPNGSYYNGCYVNGRPEGIGTFEWPNNEVYEGQWMNGTKHGSGIWKGSKGDSYIGEWKFGKADGYGVHTWVNGDRYEGQFRNCLKTGHGSEKFANGDTYVGNYENGKPDGYGEYFWHNGTVYKGEFKNGLRHGKGVWSGGMGLSERYEGTFENDKKSGHGVFTWTNGNKYDGGYKDDVREGYGEMFWGDGSFYKGNWKNGLQDGEGTLCVSGQPPKQGLFKANKMIQEYRSASNPTISELNDEVSIDSPPQKISNAKIKNKPLPVTQSTKQKQMQNQQQWALVQYQQKQQEQLASQLRELHRQQYTLQLQQTELQKNQIALAPVVVKQFSSDYFTKQANVNRSLQQFNSHESAAESDDSPMKRFTDGFTQTDFKRKSTPTSNQMKTDRMFYPKVQHRSVQISPKSVNTSLLNLSKESQPKRNIPIPMPTIKAVQSSAQYKPKQESNRYQSPTRYFMNFQELRQFGAQRHPSPYNRQMDHQSRSPIPRRGASQKRYWVPSGSIKQSISKTAIKL